MTIAFRTLATASIQGTTANIAVTDPGNIGDFLLAVWECDGAGQTCSPPDGTWTEIFNGDLFTDNASYIIWYKNTSAGGGGTLTFVAGSATLNMGLAVAAWSSVDATTPLDVTPLSTVNDDGRATPANVPAPSVTTVTANATVVYVAIGDCTSNSPSGDAFTAPSGYASRVGFFDASGWNIIGIADITQASAGASGGATGVIARTGAGFGVVGFTIPLRPASGGGSTIDVAAGTDTPAVGDSVANSAFFERILGNITRTF